ncbi:MAG: response regulator transcription factor [Anaerolineae bacterium]|nr:response regulator transcription factor [Anaerolineae bacterium]MDK1081785.1 response regulator transcription factor [Anaerolineae bacterium]
MQSLILVVDDEPKIVRLARDYLEKNGFRVVTAGDGQTALGLARSQRPDLIVLDLLMPGMDGREVCRILRAESDVPIIILTALSEESDQIAGLEIGADDYINKPFSPRALVARVRALLRRSQGGIISPAVIRVGELEIDTQAYSVTFNGDPLRLTRSEFELLALLARHPGRTLTRQQLIEDLYGEAASGVDRSVDSHVKNLRRKLESGTKVRYIETVYGVGYRFVEPINS